MDKVSKVLEIAPATRSQLTSIHQEGDSSTSLLGNSERPGVETRVPLLCNHRRPTSANKATKFLLFLLVPVNIWGFVDLSLRLSQWRKALTRDANPPCWCGTSNEEAIAMGCIYDHIAVDWLPPDCTDRDLVAEFDRSGPGPNGTWPYFVLSTVSEKEPQFAPLDIAQIDTYAAQGTDYFATREWHILHCMFIWRKQLRAGLSGKVVEPWNNHEEHIKHCSSYIVDAIRTNQRLDDIDTWIPGTNRHLDE